MNSKNVLNIINGMCSIIFLLLIVFLCKDAGAGLFVAAYLIYKFIFIILESGLRNTLAHAVGTRRSKGMYESSKKYLDVTLNYAVISGVVAGLILFLLADQISNVVYGNLFCGSILKYLGIFFLIKAICEVLCGYHIGSNNGSIVFIAEIVYGISLCILCPIMIKALTGYGEKVSNLLKAPIMINTYKVQGAVISMCICAFIMLIILIAGARGNLYKIRNSFGEGRGDVRFSTSAYIVGSCIEGLKVKSFPQVLYFLYMIIFIRSMAGSGMSVMDIYSAAGSLATKVIIIIMLQENLFGEYISAYRSKLHSDFKKDEIKNFTAALNALLKNSLLLVLPFACSIMCYSKGISEVVFASSNEMDYKIIIIIGICLIFAGLDRTFKAILASCGYSNSILLGNVSGLLAAVLYGFILASRDVTAYGLSMGLIIYFAVLSVIHAIPVMKNMTVRYNDLLARLAVTVIASILLIILDAILERFLNMNLLILILCYMCGYVIYIISLLALHGVNSRDIRSLKGTLMYYPLSFIGGLFGIR